MRATVISGLLLLLAVGAWAQPPKQTASGVSSGKAVLKAYVSAWNRHDFAGLDKILAPDAVHEDIEVREAREAQEKLSNLLLIFISEAGSHDELSLDMPAASGGSPEDARTKVAQGICIDFGYLDSVVGGHRICSDSRLCVI